MILQLFYKINIMVCIKIRFVNVYYIEIIPSKLYYLLLYDCIYSK